MATSDSKQTLYALRRRLMTGLSIKDRKWMLKTYKNCFRGDQAVQYMISSKEVTNEDDAVLLGQMLISSNIIKHVENDHGFKNEKLFYRFVEDEPSHGKNMQNENEEEVVATNVCPFNQQLMNNVFPKGWVNPKPTGRYNLIAIGAGAAGLISASSCSAIGGKAAIIESRHFGGDCLNFGCVPSKALLKVAKVIENAIYKGSEFGLNVKNYQIDFGQIMERMRKIRATISKNDSCERFTKQFGLDVYLGYAQFVGKNSIKVGNEILHFSRCVCCTGATPAIPSIPGLRKVNYLTHETIFNLSVLPERLAIIGAGPVGVEMAQAFAAFGSKVIVFDTNDRFVGNCLVCINIFLSILILSIMKNEDKEACSIIQKKLHCRFGVEFYFKCKIKEINHKNNSKQIFIRIESKPFQFEKETADHDGLDEADFKDIENEERKQQILNRISSHSTFVEKIPSEPYTLSNKTERLTRIKSNNGMKTGFGYMKTAFNVMSSQLAFDQVFVCTGQLPNVKNIGLEKAGIEFDDVTGIKVNDYLQTSNPNVYAAGDCCTQYRYTHMADAMAKIVVRNALFFGRQKQSDLLLPHCTYTNPEIAHVGAYANELQQNEIDFDVYKNYFTENDRAICDDATEGFVKIMTAKGTDKILGATIVSEHAGDLITQISVCMTQNIPLSQLSYIIYPYPTLAMAIKKCADDYNKTRLTPTSRVLLRKILSTKR